MTDPTSEPSPLRRRMIEDIAIRRRRRGDPVSTR